MYVRAYLANPCVSADDNVKFATIEVGATELGQEPNASVTCLSTAKRASYSSVAAALSLLQNIVSFIVLFCKRDL